MSDWGLTAEEKDLVQTIVHETGHLVMAMHLGWDIKRVFIGREEGREGYVSLDHPVDFNPHERHLIACAGGVASLMYGFDLDTALRGARADHRKFLEPDGVKPPPLWEEAIPILHTQRDAFNFAVKLVAERRHLWGHELFGVHERIVRTVAA